MSLNLPHRNSEYDTAKPNLTGLVDAYINTSDRAEAVVHLLQGQFIGENSGTLNDSVMFSALESIRHDLLDMKVLIEHYHEAQNKGE